MFVSSGVIWSRLWWNDDDLGNELLAGCMRGGDAYVMASASYLCARLLEFPVRGNGEGRGGGAKQFAGHVELWTMRWRYDDVVDGASGRAAWCTRACRAGSPTLSEAAATALYVCANGAAAIRSRQG